MKYLKNRQRHEQEKQLTKPESVVGLLGADMLKKIAKRYVMLKEKEKKVVPVTEDLESDLSGDMMRRLKADLERSNVSGNPMEILRMLKEISEKESVIFGSDREVEEKAIEITKKIFSGKKGLDIDDIILRAEKIELGDSEAKRDIRVRRPEKQVSNDRVDKEARVRMIQKVLTQGFAEMVKDMMVENDDIADAIPPGLSFDIYYKFISQSTTGTHRKVAEMGISGERLASLFEASSAMGRVDVSYDEITGKYVVNAKGINLMVLVYELVKGIMVVLTLHHDLSHLSDEEEQEVARQTDNLESEIGAISYGYVMAKTFKEFYDEIEQQLLASGKIEEKDPSMLPALLSWLYSLDADKFLEYCERIWNPQRDKSLWPYEDFKKAYLMVAGIERGDSDDSDIDDKLDDLLGGIEGISRADESLDVSLYALYEAYGKKTINKFLSMEYSPKVIKDLREFEILSKALKNKKEARKYLEKIANFINMSYDDFFDINSYDDPQKVNIAVEAMREWMKRPEHPKVVKTNEISEAVYALQDALGLETTGLLDNVTKKAIAQIQSQIATEWGKEVKDMITYFARQAKSERDKLEALKKEYQKQAKDPNIDGVKRSHAISKMREIADRLKQIDDAEREFKIALSDVYKQSGNLERYSYEKSGADAAYVKAFEDEDMSISVSGVGGKVFDNGHVKVYRMIGRNACVKLKNKVLDEYKQRTNTDYSYNWCIVDADYRYQLYRFNAAGKALVTYYMVVNVDRMKAVADPNFKVKDGLHFFVALARKNGRMRIEPADNPGLGVSSGASMTFDEFVKIVFPSEEEVKNGTYKKTIIDVYTRTIHAFPKEEDLEKIIEYVKEHEGTWWSPDKEEKRKLREAFINVEMQPEESVNATSVKNGGLNFPSYENVSYEDKEKIVNTFINSLMEESKPYRRREKLLNALNDKDLLERMPVDFILRILKSAFAGIPKGAYDRIKEVSPKRINDLKRILRMMINGDDVHESYIEHLKKAVVTSRHNFKDIYLLNDTELKLLDENDLKKYINGIKEILSYARERGAGYAIPIIEKYYNKIALSKKTLAFDEKFNQVIEKLGISEELKKIIPENRRVTIDPTEVGDIVANIIEKLPNKAFVDYKDLVMKVNATKGTDKEKLSVISKSLKKYTVAILYRIAEAMAEYISRYSSYSKNDYSKDHAAMLNEMIDKIYEALKDHPIEAYAFLKIFKKQMSKQTYSYDALIEIHPNFIKYINSKMDQIKKKNESLFNLLK